MLSFYYNYNFVKQTKDSTLDQGFNYDYFKNNDVQLVHESPVTPPIPVELPWDFVKPELYDTIRDILSRKDGAVSVLKGRRRVGKSVCVRQVCSEIFALKGLKFFCITCGKTEKGFVSAITDEIRRLHIVCPHPRNLRSCIRFLLWIFARGYRVILDEYQLCDSMPDFFDNLKVQFNVCHYQ